MAKDLGETDKFRVMMSKSGYAPPRNGNAPYLIAVISALFITIAGSAVIIFIRPDYDPIIIIVGIGTATGAVTTQLLQFMKLNEVAQKAEIAVVQSKETQIQTDATHAMVNSTLSAALETARKAGYGAGLEAGAIAANERTDALAQASLVLPVVAVPAVVYQGVQPTPAPTKEVATEVGEGMKIKGTIEGTIEEKK